MSPRRRCSRGHRVRALVRPTSDTRWIDQLGRRKGHRRPREYRGSEARSRRSRLGVQLRGQGRRLGHTGGVPPAQRGRASAHSWKPPRTLGVERFVHVSSLGVYEGRDHHGTDETVPPAANSLDAYTRSKTEAEALVMEYHRQRGLPAAVIRPGFIYGERDRTVLPKLLANLRRGTFAYFGSGEQALNCIYVEEPRPRNLPRRRESRGRRRGFQPHRWRGREQDPVRQPSCRTRRAEAADTASSARPGKIPGDRGRGRRQAPRRDPAADYQQGPLQVSRPEP